MNTNTNVSVFSLRLAGWLMWHGYICCGIKPNTDGSGRFVYYFKDSEAIREHMSDFKNHRKPNE